MEATEPFEIRHVRVGHDPSVVRNKNSLSKLRGTSSETEPPRSSARLAGEDAVTMITLEPDFWCLSCPYFQNPGRRITKSLPILSSAKDNFMASRLDYFKMPASFESKEAAEKFIPTFKDVVESMQEPVRGLDAWSKRKAAHDAQVDEAHENAEPGSPPPLYITKWWSLHSLSLSLPSPPLSRKLQRPRKWLRTRQL